MTSQITQLLRAGKIDHAAQLLDPPQDTAEHWRAAGVFHAWRHEWPASQSAFQRALDHQSPDAEWWCDVGLALIGSGAPEQALKALEKSIALEETPRGLVHTGEALELLSRDAAAYDRFTRASALDPKFADPIDGLVRVACKLGRDEEALQHAKHAARLHRFDARSLQIVADMQFYSAQLQSCLRTYRRAMQRDPTAPGIYSAYLFASIHDPRQTAASLRAMHEEWFRVHGRARDDHRFAASACQRLRIGYIGVEFRSSPTEYYLLPVMEAHDRERFHIYCYHYSRSSDAVTEKYKHTATHWREIGALSEDEIVRTIRADQLDLLIDASGHFAPPLMRVLSRRVAPVQIGFPVYPCTRGSQEIDHLLSDRWMTPDGAAEEQYVEKICRIPSGAIVYVPPQDAPEPNELPARANGYVTFGLFQRPAKFNDDLWRAMGAILHDTPEAHLLVHHGTRDLEHPQGAMRRYIVDALKRYGVCEERIDFVGRREVREHLNTVAQCDIALDTFPYSGHTTSGDALWMGVPVVTLAGQIHASRVTSSLLARVGLEDWVADSLARYVEIAVKRANDLDGLARVRRDLRGRMAESSIVKAREVVAEMEKLYRLLRAEVV